MMVIIAIIFHLMNLFQIYQKVIINKNQDLFQYLNKGNKKKRSIKVYKLNQKN